MEAPKETPAEEDDSDDDIGPMPMKPSEPKEEKKEEPAPKESYELSDLPCAAMYEKSYTHPSHVLFTCVTPKTDFVYTKSVFGVTQVNSTCDGCVYDFSYIAAQGKSDSS